MRGGQDGDLEVTVTYLEMTRPPPAPAGRPPDAGVALIRSAPPTLSFYRYLYDTVGEPWLWHQRRAMPQGRLEALVRDPAIEVHVLHVHGTPAGYAEIDRRLGALTGEVGLAYFGLIPDFIGQRLGPWLLDQTVRLAWREGTRRLVVNTCTFDHPKALPLYQAQGFRPFRHVTRRIPDPRLIGLMPRTAAPHIPLAL